MFDFLFILISSRSRVCCNVHSIFRRPVGIIWRLSVLLHIILCKSLIININFQNYIIHTIHIYIYKLMNMHEMNLMQMPCIMWLVTQKPKAFSFHWSSSWVCWPTYLSLSRFSLCFISKLSNLTFNLFLCLIDSRYPSFLASCWHFFHQ